MKLEEAISRLDKLVGDDAEMEHEVAEDILLLYLRSHRAAILADAFEAARERAHFWYA